MKKLLFGFLVLILFISCSKKESVKEPVINKVKIVYSKDISADIEVLNDNGVLYVNKNELKKLLETSTIFKEIILKNNILSYKDNYFLISNDFSTSYMDKELIGDINFKLKDLDTEDKQFMAYSKWSFSIKGESNKQKLSSLNYNNETYVNLYEIINNQNFNFVKIYKEKDEYCVLGKEFNKIDIPITFDNPKINEFTYNIVYNSLEGLVKLDLVSKDALNYMEKNREKILRNSYKELKKLSNFVNRTHFIIAPYSELQLALGNSLDKKMVFAEGNIKNPVSSEISTKTYGENTGYIKISSFSMNEYLSDEFEKSLKPLFNKKNIIIDLRNNTGGLDFNQCYLLNMFGENNFKYYKGLRGNKKVLLPRFTDTLYKGNVVLLVNKMSASASNIFANSFKANKLGTIIGEKTYGLSDGISPTILPNGMVMLESKLVLETDDKFQSIDNGIEPDIFIEDAAKGNDNDPILTKAINLCK